MPNIEIHGIPGPEEETNKLATAITNALRNSVHARKIVIATSYDIVLDLESVEQPFLRVLGTNEGELEEVITLLEPFHLDIEVVLLRRFIPHG
jgi:hypothetical protein